MSQWVMTESKTIELFAFSHFDPVRQRWIRARYRAELETLRERYGDQFKTEGEPERREVRLVTPIGLHNPC